MQMIMPKYYSPTVITNSMSFIHNQIQYQIIIRGKLMEIYQLYENQVMFVTSRLYNDNIVNIFYYQSQLLICFKQKIITVRFDPQLVIQETIILQYEQEKFIIIESDDHQWIIISLSKQENSLTFTTQNISKNFPFHKGQIIDISASNNMNRYCILHSGTYVSAQTTLLQNNGLNSIQLSIYNNLNQNIYTCNELSCTSYKCYYYNSNVIVLYAIGIIIIDSVQQTNEINLRFRRLIEEGELTSIDNKINNKPNAFSSYYHKIFDETFKKERDRRLVIINQMDNKEDVPTVQIDPRLIIIDDNQYILLTDHQGMYSICKTSTDKYQLNKLKINFELDDKLVFNGCKLINNQLFLYGLMSYSYYTNYQIVQQNDNLDDEQQQSQQQVEFFGIKLNFQYNGLIEQMKEMKEVLEIDRTHIELNYINKIWSESPVQQGLDSSVCKKQSDKKQQKALYTSLSLLHFDGTIQQIKSSIYKQTEYNIYQQKDRILKQTLIEVNKDYIDLLIQQINKNYFLRLYTDSDIEEQKKDVTELYQNLNITNMQIIISKILELDQQKYLLLITIDGIIIYNINSKQIEIEIQKEIFSATINETNDLIYITQLEDITQYKIQLQNQNIQLIELKTVDLQDVISFQEKQNFINLSISKIDQQLQNLLNIQQNEVLSIVIDDGLVQIVDLDFKQLFSFILMKNDKLLDNPDVQTKISELNYNYEQNQIEDYSIQTSQIQFITDGYNTYMINYMYGGGAQIYQIVIFNQNINIIKTELLVTDQVILKENQSIQIYQYNDRRYVIPCECEQIQQNIFHLSNPPIQQIFTPYSFVIGFTQTHGIVIFKDNQIFDTVKSNSEKIQVKIENEDNNNPLRNIIKYIIEGEVRFLGLYDNENETDIIYLEQWNFGSINNQSQNIQQIIDRNIPNSIGLWRKYISINRNSIMFAYHRNTNNYVVITQRYQQQTKNYIGMRKHLLVDKLIKEILKIHPELKDQTKNLLRSRETEQIFNFYCYEPVYQALLVRQDGKILDQDTEIIDHVNCISSCYINCKSPQQYGKSFFVYKRTDESGCMDRRIRNQNVAGKGEQVLSIKLNEFIFIGTGYIMEMMNRQYGQIIMYNVEGEQGNEQLVKIGIQETKEAAPTCIIEVPQYNFILAAEGNFIEGYEIQNLNEFVRVLRTFGFGYIYNMQLFEQFLLTQDAIYSDYISTFQQEGMRITRLGQLPQTDFLKKQYQWQWLVSSKNQQNKKGVLLLSNGYEIYQFELQNQYFHECQVKLKQKFNGENKIVSNLNVPSLVQKYIKDFKQKQSTWNGISISLDGQIVECICCYPDIIQEYYNQQNETIKMIINNRIQLSQGYW